MGKSYIRIGAIVLLLIGSMYGVFATASSDQPFDTPIRIWPGQPFDARMNENVSGCHDTYCLAINETDFVTFLSPYLASSFMKKGGDNTTGNYTFDSVFKIDDTNDRIGIGTSNPTVALDVVGEVKISGVSSDGSGRVLCIKSDGSIGSAGIIGGLIGSCS